MEEFIKQYFEKLNIQLSDMQAKQFETYKNLLTKWNKVMNLTGITNEREICIKHFADSVTPLLYCDFRGKSAIDIGTGAGFPGLPIKIVQSECDMTLLDSLQKRLNFLQEVCRACGIQTQFVHARAEELGHDESFREKYDIALSRAVAPLNILCEYDLPYVKAGGLFIALKGPNAYEEIKSAENAVKELGGSIADVKEIHLPDTDLNHNIVIIEKITQTPSVYPRRAKKMERSPL